jgi:hypothetical protein
MEFPSPYWHRLLVGAAPWSFSIEVTVRTLVVAALAG